MPYFVRIGAIHTNWHGVGSRGYQIFRKGHRVTVRWGSVEVSPGRHFRWTYTQEKIFPHPSVRAAAEWIKKEIKRRTTREKYSKLPSGHKILPPASKTG